MELQAIFHEIKILGINAIPNMVEKSSQFEYCLNGLNLCKGLMVRYFILFYYAELYL